MGYQKGFMQMGFIDTDGFHPLLDSATQILLQKDYEAIEDFNGDWSSGLRAKYNLTHDEVLENIDL